MKYTVLKMVYGFVYVVLVAASIRVIMMTYTDPGIEGRLLCAVMCFAIPFYMTLFMKSLNGIDQQRRENRSGALFDMWE